MKGTIRTISLEYSSMEYWHPNSIMTRFSIQDDASHVPISVIGTVIGEPWKHVSE